MLALVLSLVLWLALPPSPSLSLATTGHQWSLSLSLMVLAARSGIQTRPTPPASTLSALTMSSKSSAGFPLPSLFFLAWRVFFCLCLVGSAPSDVLVPSEMSMRCTFMETQEDAIYTVLQRTLVLLWIILVRDSHYQRTRQWKR